MAGAGCALKLSIATDRKNAIYKGTLPKLLLARLSLRLVIEELEIARVVHQFHTL
jgi:hypothetical protein